jgi:DNA polymerase-3 subunit gamma/tau
MAAAPDRPELTSVSPQFRDQLPDLAKTIGRSRLLQWQAQLRGTEQQLRQSVQPRLWLEVLLLGLLAEAATPTAVSPAAKPVAPSAPAVNAAQGEPEATTQPTAADAVAAAATSTPAATPELPDLSGSNGSNSTNLPELWQQILGSLELPSTRMLLSQQGQLVRLDAHRAVVQVAGNWMGMVQSRTALLEQAIAKALGGSRQLILEPQSGSIAPAPTPAPVVSPTVIAQQPPAIQQPVVTKPPSPQVVVKTTPAVQVEQQAPAPTTPSPGTASPARPSPTNPPTPQVPPKQQMAKPDAGATGIERQAKNLADFFNGQVLDVDLDD